MKILVKNKQASFLYLILETFEAGISLTGTEVKSLRLGTANLGDAYVKFKNGEALLSNAHFSIFTEGTYNNHDPLRIRKLLLHKREIEKLRRKVEEKGLTVVPLKIYSNKDNRIKIEIALVQGKKTHDKRDALAARDQKREVERAFKNQG
ncbi:SsrA-binding protein SmpB [bacterium]|nr:SsrA-binding protein SmpB [bacterium]